jgi:predicted Zn finger-like uncharacterized protein
MIAACPKCSTRYRIERDKIGPDGVRLRCTRCTSVFRVRAPEPVAAAPEPAPAPEAVQPDAPIPSPVPERVAPTVAPDAPIVGVALPDEEMGKQVAELLAQQGFRSFVVTDGVEAMLEIQRRCPVAVVLCATLPRMYGFQVCEIVKRNESLRSIHVVLVGAIFHKDRYRRPPEELYGADEYIEEPDLPEGLVPILGRLRSPTTPSRAPATPPPSGSGGVPDPIAAPAPRSGERSSPIGPAPEPHDPSADGLDEERAKAERLARIIVSDIVLYNEARFAEAVRAGTPLESLAAELAEGRALFAERVDPRVREQIDHLRDELLRVARLRGMS